MWSRALLWSLKCDGSGTVFVLSLSPKHIPAGPVCLYYQFGENTDQLLTDWRGRETCGTQLLPAYPNLKWMATTVQDTEPPSNVYPQSTNPQLTYRSQSKHDYYLSHTKGHIQEGNALGFLPSLLPVALVQLEASWEESTSKAVQKGQPPLWQSSAQIGREILLGMVGVAGS